MQKSQADHGVSSADRGRIEDLLLEQNEIISRLTVKKSNMEILLPFVSLIYLLESHLLSRGYEILLLIYITVALWIYIGVALLKVSAQLRKYEQGGQGIQVEIHEAFKQMYLNRNVRTKYGTIGVVTDISKDKTGRPLMVNLSSGVSIPHSVDEVSLV